MKKMKNCLLCFVVVSFATCAMGYQYWDDGAPGHLWSTAGNWNPDFVPTNTEDIDITSIAAHGPVIKNGISATAKYLCIGAYSPNAGAGVTMSGGTLTVGEWMVIGGRPGYVETGGPAIGILDMSGGTLKVLNAGLSIGNGAVTGLLNMTGGSVETPILVCPRVENPSDPSTFSSGWINLFGGEITTNSLQLTSGGVLDISEGKLKVAGNAVSQINSLVASGRITAYRHIGTVIVDNTTDPAWTIVTAQAPSPFGLTYWNDASIRGHLWTDPANWHANIVPTGSIGVDVTSIVPNGPIINSGDDAEASFLGIGSYSPNGVATVTMTGGSLTLGGGAGYMIVGGRLGVPNQGQTDKGILNISGGYINAMWGWIAIGNDGIEGELNMTGGSIETNWFGVGRDNEWESKAKLKLHGGVITVRGEDQFVIGSLGSIDIAGGTLRIADANKSMTTAINAWVGDGKIAAFNGDGTVIVDTESSPGWTVVYAVAPACYPNYLKGDVNHDCTVNMDDFVMMARNWLLSN